MWTDHPRTAATVPTLTRSSASLPRLYARNWQHKESWYLRLALGFLDWATGQGLPEAWPGYVSKTPDRRSHFTTSGRVGAESKCGGRLRYPLTDDAHPRSALYFNPDVRVRSPVRLVTAELWGAPRSAP